MSDVQQIQLKHQKYRYTIPELMELSATAYLTFDLSKFTYDAARAGVVPPLGGCAMASRKSSASLGKVNNFDGASPGEALVFTGNRGIRPERQPQFPPPVERQKDEGFAKFLRKHSSPTHNRVTTGGRIVPMEPRSPPPFSLPSNVTNRPQAVSAEQSYQYDKRNVNDHWDSAGQLPQEQETHYFSQLSADQSLPVAERQYYAGIAREPMQHTSVANPMQHTYNAQPAVNNFASLASRGTPVPSYLSSQQMGGPVMQPMHAQQYNMGQYHSGALVNLGTGVSLADHYNAGAGWPLLNQAYNQVYPVLQPVMSVPQMLAAYQQHYQQLDQQLKAIDRHRAVHPLLDPQLVEQRKTIVQQRSDAKDRIREYQGMLGLKRMTDSSEDSFMTGFNVDAPAYVPRCEVSTAGTLTQQRSFGAIHNVPIFEKPLGSAQKRVIPIRPPPEALNRNQAEEQSPVEDDDDRVSVDEWGVQKRRAPPEIEREQSELSETLRAEYERHMNSQQDLQYNSDAQAFGSSYQDLRSSEEYLATDQDGHEHVSSTTTRSSDVGPPPSQEEEERNMLDALNQPKGTVTTVRTIHNRYRDIEGQRLSLGCEPPPSHSWNQRRQSRSSSWRSRGHDAAVNECDTRPRGKENLHVAPVGHQKAATDAFLSQFNAVEDNMALATKYETQSLRTASNGRAEYSNQTVIWQPSPTKVASRESLARQLAGTGVSAEPGPPAYATPEADGTHARTDPAISPDELNHKGYSSVSVQNVHAVGSLPNNFDGAVEARQSVQAQLGAASKTRSPKSPKSPKFLRRFGGNGGA